MYNKTTKNSSRSSSNSSFDNTISEKIFQFQTAQDKRKTTIVVEEEETDNDLSQ